MKQIWATRLTTGADAYAYYGAPEKGGGFTPDTFGTLDNRNYGMVAAASGTLSSLLAVRTSAAGTPTGPGVGKTETWTIYVNGSPTSLTTSVSGTSTENTDSTNSATVSAGDIVTLVRTFSGAAPSAATSCVSMLFTGVVPLASMHGGNVSISSSTGYVAPFSMYSGSVDSTRLSYRGTSIVGCYGDVKRLYVRLSAAPGVGKSYTFDLLVNGAAVAAASVTISDLATTGSSSFTAAVVPVVVTAGVPVSAADQLSIRITSSGSPSGVRANLGLQFLATPLEIVNIDTLEVIADIEDNICNYGVNGDIDGSGNQEYFETNPPGGGALTQVYFTDAGGPDFNVALCNLGMELTTAPGGANGRGARPQYFSGGVFTDVWAGGNPNATGAVTFGGTSTVSGATQFAVYTTGDARRFVIRQFPTAFPAASDVLTTFMMLCGSYDAQTLAFDGTISGISPDEGPDTGSTAFTITGTGFEATAGGGSANILSAAVTLKGIAATSVTIVNDTTITGTSAAGSAGLGDVVITFTTDGADSIETILDGWTYTSSASWYVVSGDPDDPSTWVYSYTDDPPDDAFLAPADPEPYGWWISSEGLAGGPTVADGSKTPKGPRTLAEVDVFATGAAAHLQGNCATAFRNKLIYAARGYIVDTDDPPLRIFDGQTDRLLARVPKDASLAPAEAIISILAANGTIYVGTLDNNAGGGRVLQFDLDTLAFTPMGAAFGSGEVPYTLCWHMGRLFVGTNDGDGSACSVYFIRPGIDSAFTTDYTLTTSSLGGAASMASFRGKLYVGTDNIATANGKVLARTELAAYSVVETGSGTAAMNGYVSMIVFKDNLYAAYWNSVGTVSTIRKFDGSSWTTVYTGTGATAVPILALFTHDGFLYALFGTGTTAAVLLRSDNGSSYTDLSAFLDPAGGIIATPAYASVRF